MKVPRKIWPGFDSGVNAAKPCWALARPLFHMRDISKLTFKTRVAGKLPLHLSWIIHIESAYRFNTNDLRNKKTGVERPFFIDLQRR
jgi:hypothetical protein